MDIEKEYIMNFIFTPQFQKYFLENMKDADMKNVNAIAKQINEIIAGNNIRLEDSFIAMVTGLLAFMELGCQQSMKLKTKEFNKK